MGVWDVCSFDLPHASGSFEHSPECTTSILLDCCCAHLITSSFRYIATWPLVVTCSVTTGTQRHRRTFLFKWTTVIMALLQNPRGPHSSPSIWAFRDSPQKLYPPLDSSSNTVSAGSYNPKWQHWLFYDLKLRYAPLGLGATKIGSFPGHLIKGWRSTSKGVYSDSKIQRALHCSGQKLHFLRDVWG